MSNFGKGAERREFGRRETCLRAFISVTGRPRIPCVVRDISVGGALLELDIPSWLPFNFELVIEASRFRTTCEVRHQRANAVGVRFVAAHAVATPERARTRVDTCDEWMGRR